MTVKNFSRILDLYTTANQRTITRVANKMSVEDSAPAPMPSRSQPDRQFMMTPGQAMEFARIDHFYDQRPVRAGRLEELIEKALDGRFRKSEIAIAYFEDKKYLVNGRHTCLTSILTNMSLEVVVSHYKCNTKEELTCLWQQFDTGGKRSSSDMAAGTAREMGEEWTPQKVSLLAKGLAMKLTGNVTDQYSMSIEDKHKLVIKYPNICNAVRNIVFSSGKMNRKWKHLAKGAVIAAIISSLEEDKELAVEFWSRVGDGDGLRTTEPAFKLREFLMKSNTSRVKTPTDKIHATEEGVMTKSIAEWKSCLKTHTAQKKSLEFVTKPPAKRGRPRLSPQV